MTNLCNLIAGKTVVVTGGTGSIGSEIVRQVLAAHPKMVRVFSRSEHGQYELMRAFGPLPNLVCLIGDVRDADRVQQVTVEADLIFHAAAMKHVPICEFNPTEARKTNVNGAENVVRAAIINRVQHVIAVSTDKAAEPINMMGTTKLAAERIFSAARYQAGVSGTQFTCVRFGNVLGSRGSVIPHWVGQMAARQPLTVTDPNMTRFFLSIPQAVRLVFEGLRRAQGGEIFILKMPVVRIGDLADAVVDQYAPQLGLSGHEVERQMTGPRPGEKSYELLMTTTEAEQALEVANMFIVPPTEMIPLRSDGRRQYDGASPVNPEERVYDSRRPLPISARAITGMLRDLPDLVGLLRPSLALAGGPPL